MMRFVHYSNRHVSLADMRNVEQIELRKRGRADKPDGLWFSVGVDWPRWCRSEAFRYDCLTHATEIIFRPDADVLRLSSAGALDEFTEKYSMEPPWGNSELLGDFLMAFYLDWAAVAMHWDAIVIAPYLWERRNHNRTFWYYSLDCASGCVWNAKAVAELRPRRPKFRPVPVMEAAE